MQFVKRYALLLCCSLAAVVRNVINRFASVGVAHELRHVQVTAQLSKASGQYNNGVISFLLHGQDGSDLSATRVVTDSVHHHNVSPLVELCFPSSSSLMALAFFVSNAMDTHLFCPVCCRRG